MTKLQIALDGDLAAALDVLAQVHPFVDIAEIGTPLVFREGMRAVRRIRPAYPQLTLVADLKIMDAGRAEADIAFGAGADRVTVMALASDATITGALTSARSHNKRVMIDMMQVADPWRGRGSCWRWAAICSACTPPTTCNLRRLRLMPSWRSCVLRCRPRNWPSPAASSWIRWNKFCRCGRRSSLSARASPPPWIQAPTRANSTRGYAMSMHHELVDAILADVGRTLRQVDAQEIEALGSALLAAERIFLAGKGRTGLQMRAFAMRLMHLGLTVHVVDDVTTPAIGAGDLLLIGSSSGRTGSLLRYVETVIASGARLATMTGNLDSPIATSAHCRVYIPATNFKAGDRAGEDSVLVMGSLFEHCLGLLCDLLIIRLKAALDVDEAAMNALHANLE